MKNKFENKQRDANESYHHGRFNRDVVCDTYIVTNIDARTFIGDVERMCVAYAGSKIGTVTELERSM